MDKSKINENVEQFMKDLKAVESRDDFYGKMKEYENQFYGFYEKSMQDNLLDELKKKQFQPEQQESQGFLRAPTQVEKDYMQGQNRYNKFSRQKDDEQSAHLRAHFQLSTEGQFNTYVPPKFNYIDVQANSKQYYPDQEMFIKDFNRPQQSFSNAQNIFLNRNIPANIQGQEVKDIYPHKLFTPHDQEVSHPYFLTQDQPSQALRQNMQKLGGVQDMISVMEPSLRDHERQGFFEKNRFDVFSHNTGVNDPNYFPFPQAAVISNVQNRPISLLSQGQSIEQQQSVLYNPFERNPYPNAKLQDISPVQRVANPMNSNAPSMNSQQYNRGYVAQAQSQQQQQYAPKMSIPRPPSSSSSRGYDGFLNNTQGLGQLPTGKYGSLQESGRNQFDLGGPVFMNNANRY